MSKVGKPYKKTVELRKGNPSDIADDSLITIGNPNTTEDFNLDKVDFLIGVILNETELTIPFRKDNQFKDSQVRFDSTLGILIASIPAIVPWSTQNVSTSSANVASHIQRVYVRTTTTLTLEDRGSSGFPVVIRVISGIATVQSSVGTVENGTLTVGQSSTTAFDSVDEVWYEE